MDIKDYHRYSTVEKHKRNHLGVFSVGPKNVLLTLANDDVVHNNVQHRKRVFFVGLDGEFHFPDGANIPEVTTREAISDLPPLDVEHEKTHEFDYPRPPDNDYQRYIRGASKRITQHLITMPANENHHRYDSGRWKNQGPTSGVLGGQKIQQSLPTYAKQRRFCDR